MASAPGENHAFLASFVGTWHATVKVYMGTGEPSVSDGTSVNTMILGGRYLQQAFKSTMAGEPFEGVGITGFDNTAKRFTGIWVDNMGTGIMRGTGFLSPDKKVLTTYLAFADPETGSEKSWSETMFVADADHHLVEMFDSPEPGKGQKVMEISYSRR